MSASNWAFCPRCAKAREAQLDKMRAELAASYGVVPVEEYEQRRRLLATAEGSPTPETLREDYEIYGAEDGTVVVEYGNSCAACGLETTFNHRHEMEV